MYVQSSGEGLSNGFLSGSPRTKFAALNTRERKKETHYKACWQLSNWIRFFLRDFETIQTPFFCCRPTSGDTILLLTSYTHQSFLPCHRSIGKERDWGEERKGKKRACLAVSTGKEIGLSHFLEFSSRDYTFMKKKKKFLSSCVAKISPRKKTEGKGEKKGRREKKRSILVITWLFRVPMTHACLRHGYSCVDLHARTHRVNACVLSCMNK